MTDEPTYDLTVRGLTRAQIEQRAGFSTPMPSANGSSQFHVAACAWVAENPPLIPVTVMLTREEAEMVATWDSTPIMNKCGAAAKAALAEQDES